MTPYWLAFNVNFFYSNELFFLTNSLLKGNLRAKLSDSALGAIITHAEVTDDGKYVISAESGYAMYWQIDKESQKVIFKEEQRNVLQIILYDEKKKGLFASKGKKHSLGLGNYMTRSLSSCFWSCTTGSSVSSQLCNFMRNK